LAGPVMGPQTQKEMVQMSEALYRFRPSSDDKLWEKVDATTIQWCNTHDVPESPLRDGQPFPTCWGWAYFDGHDCKLVERRLI